MFQRKATKIRFYCWTHWFWITCIILSPISTVPLPLSSFETISTSLKSSTSLKTSALIQNDNSFQKPINLEQSKFEQIKQNSMVSTLESETDSVFDGGGGSGRNDSIGEIYISSPDKTAESTAVTTTNLTSVKLSSSSTPGLNVITLNNLDNSTNSTSISNTTVLNSITEGLR